jgi:hypothetical protein
VLPKYIFLSCATHLFQNKYVPQSNNSPPSLGTAELNPTGDSVWWPEDKNSPNLAHTCRKRRPWRVPSAWGMAGSPRLQGSEIRMPGPPGWGLGVVLTATPRKIHIVRKSKEVTVGRGRLLRKAMAYKRLSGQRWQWWWTPQENDDTKQDCWTERIILKCYLEERVCWGADWNRLAQYVLRPVTIPRFPREAGNVSTSLDTASFSTTLRQWVSYSRREQINPHFASVQRARGSHGTTTTWANSTDRGFPNIFSSSLPSPLKFSTRLSQVPFQETK